MGFKIGDKVTIHDGFFSVKLTGGTYDKHGVHGVAKVEGVIKAINCRLPLYGCYYESVCPTVGVEMSGGLIIYNDLLVQTEDGFVFTSTRHVKLVPVKPPKYYVYIFGSIKMEITKKQYDEIKKAEIALFGNTDMRVLEVENEEI